MKVKMLVSTFIQGQARKEGDIIDVPRGLAQALIAAKRAEVVGAETEIAEKAAKRGRKGREKAMQAAAEAAEKAVKE